MTNLERLFCNIKVFIEAGVLEDEFNVFIAEYPELDSIRKLNEVMETEIAYWGVC
jgi:hypothetical protein